MDDARIQQAEQRVEENRQKARTRCWKIQATNAFAYYQFAMLHFLQEVQRSQLVVAHNEADVFRAPYDRLEQMDVGGLQSLMQEMLTKFYHGGEREATVGRNFYRDLENEGVSGVADAFKTDARPRHVPEDYRLFQACENGGEEDCEIKLFNHRKAADVTFNETWRSADVLINIIQQAQIIARETGRSEYNTSSKAQEYVKHLTDVKNSMLYIQKTRREMLRVYDKDDLGSGIGSGGQVKTLEAMAWASQHELFWKRI